MGYCPSQVTYFPGVSSGVPGFAWSWGDDHSSPFSLRWLLLLSVSAVTVRWLVYSCNTGTVWGPFPYPLDFPFAKGLVGVCCYGDSKHCWTPLSLGAAAVPLLKQQLLLIGQFSHYSLSAEFLAISSSKCKRCNEVGALQIQWKDSLLFKERNT